jgi:hypothetical protein
MDQSIEKRELPVGSLVEVRSRYLGTWTRGFQIEDRTDGGYVIRRLSDGSCLPEIVAFDEVAPVR